MYSLTIKEDRTIWLAFLISLLIHGLLFAFSPRTFIQQAQYSVQPSTQTVEVSIEEAKDSSVVSRNSDVILARAGILKDVVLRFPIKTFGNDKGMDSRFRGNDKRLKQAKHSVSGVQVKANPDYFQNPPPEYPELARQMRQEGLVMLSVDVNTEGAPVNVVIIQSCGYRMLDQAALKAVRHWKFQPGSIGGILVESTVTVPIRFRLES